MPSMHYTTMGIYHLGGGGGWVEGFDNREGIIRRANNFLTLGILSGGSLGARLASPQPHIVAAPPPLVTMACWICKGFGLFFYLLLGSS